MEREKRFVHNVPAARRLRRDQTSTEALLWRELRDRRFRGLKFRRQHAVGGYVLDFFCADERLAVEVDGGVHNDAEQRERDQIRQEILEEQGIRFVRVAAWEVKRDMERVLAAIEAALTPGPAGEG